MLGIPGIIDLHAHFMPARLMQRVWQYFDAAGPKIGRDWPIRYRDTDAVRLATLAELGVIATTTLNYAHRPGMARSLNEWSRGFATEHGAWPGAGVAGPAIIPSLTFFPERRAAEEVADALAAGGRVAKVHVQVGEFDVRDPLLTPAWALLAEAGVPVVLHAGSGPVPGSHTGPGPVADLMDRHPRLRLVIAHLGAPEVGEFLDLCDRHPSMGLDTTMVGTDFMNQMMPVDPVWLPRLHRLGLTGRVYFGSDFPNIPYPYAHAVEALVRWDMGEEWLRAVLHDNAERLLTVLD